MSDAVGRSQHLRSGQIYQQCAPSSCPIAAPALRSDSPAVSAQFVSDRTAGSLSQIPGTSGEVWTLTRLLTVTSM
jgi:hypothetical protein